MLTIARGVFGNIMVERKNISEAYGVLRGVSFMFRVNNYTIVPHNISAVKLETQRILAHRNICAMCVQISFIGRKVKLFSFNLHRGYVNYTNVRNKEHYTRATEYSVLNYFVLTFYNEGFRTLSDTCHAYNSIRHMYTDIHIAQAYSQSANVSIQNVETTYVYMHHSKYKYCCHLYYE